MTRGMLRITEKHKLVITAAAAAAAVGIAGWGYGRAALRVTGGDAVRAALQEKIGRRTEERHRAKLSDAVMKRRAQDLARVTTFLIDRRSPVAFLEAVERAAARTGNTIAIDVDEGKSSESFLRFRFTAEGGERSIIRFVQALELLPYRLDIREMAFQNLITETAEGGERGGSARLVLALDVAAQ